MTWLGDQMTIEDLGRRLAGKKVGIIGDVMVDRYVYGHVDRISPEAPVPVLRFDREEQRLGGAANVALNVLGLGSTPVIAAVVGDDASGRFVCDRLNELSSPSDYVVQSSARPTTVKSRYMGNHQHIMRMDQETTADLSAAEEADFMAQVESMLSHEDLSILILQDYNKGVLNAARIQQIIGLAKQRDLPVVVDPKFDHFFDYSGATLFKPNLRELSQGLGRPIAPRLDELNQAMTVLRDRMDVPVCMVTLGAHGIYLSRRSVEAVLVPTRPTKVVDVCGAGDAVVAASALLFGESLGDEAIGRVCNVVGRLVCGYPGVSPIIWSQLAEAMQRDAEDVRSDEGG